jgi:hypothetical protein
VPPLVMVHGWMDVAASYQFVVDALSQAFAGRQIIAPGLARLRPDRPARHRQLLVPDYLADLDFLLDHYAPASRSTWSATAWAATW